MNAYQKINEMITARLIERIEATNTLPWKKPWKSIILMSRNLRTQKNDQGVSLFLLHMPGYTSVVSIMCPSVF
jgi:antirestriction protein ArdC